MKWVQEVWGLFVDEPIMALLAVVSLGIGLLLSKIGLNSIAGLAMFLVIAIAIGISVHRDA
jgi:hypothetical protein